MTHTQRAIMEIQAAKTADHAKVVSLFKGMAWGIPAYLIALLVLISYRCTTGVVLLVVGTFIYHCVKSRFNRDRK